MSKRMIIEQKNDFFVFINIVTQVKSENKWYIILIHKEKSNKMQQYIWILLFHIYMKLNMFRATHHPSWGA